MNKRSTLQNLQEVVHQIKQAEKHLKASYRRCQKIGLEGPHSEENLIDFEALTARFARLVDMLIHKLYRSIDACELIDGGTLIDTTNRAEKKGLVDSAMEIRALKDLRNDIAHEYLADKLTELQEEVYQSIPKLLQLITKALNYADSVLKTC